MQYARTYQPSPHKEFIKYLTAGIVFLTEYELVEKYAKVTPVLRY